MNQFFDKIFITGYKGYLGSSFIRKFQNYNFKLYERDHKIKISDCNVVLHFAGKAHNLSSKWDDYEVSNIILTKKIFNEFLKSDAKTFIYISSIKAVCDYSNDLIHENAKCNPATMYGKSKRISETYILNNLPSNKKVYILRPSMIYGENNKGNLNSLIYFLSKFRLWPFASINSKHTFCSIDNIFYVINNLISSSIQSGIYNVCDNNSVSLKDLINWIKNEKKIKILYLYFPFIFYKLFLNFMPKTIVLKFNKLMRNNLLSNKKICDSIGNKLPVNSIIETSLNN